MNNMKHSFRSLTSGALMAAVALMATGCSSEENTSTTYVAEGTPITVNAVVGEMETKAGYSDENLPQTFYLKIEHPTRENFSYYALMDRSTGSWVAYDGKSSTTPPTELKMYWAGDGNPVKVTAATYDFSTSSEPSVQTDQSKSIDGSDVLVMLTDDDVTPATEGIDVTLKHLMAKLKVKVDMGKETNYTENLITDFVVGGTQTKRAFDLGTNTFSDPTATTVDDIKAYTDAKTMFTPSTLDESVVTAAATANYEAILVPQEVKTGVLEINFSLGNKSYNWTSTKDFTFESNKQYTLTLKLIGDKVAMKDVSVSGWVDTPQNLGTGELAEAESIPVLEIDANNLRVTETRIAEVLKNGKLKIKGEMTVEDVAVLATNKTIEVLDLSEAKAVTGFDINSIAFIYVDNGKVVINTTLKEVTLPNEMTEIAGDAFYNCAGLESVTIPANVTTIGKEAFIQCTNLKAVTFKGNALTTIGNSAFSYCTNLPGIELPSSVTTIGGSAFYGCSKLTTITLPDNLTSIGGDDKEEGSAFQDCDLLEEITIPSGVTVIPSESFYDCPNLKTVTCKGNVTKIGAMAFYNNSYTSSNLTSIYLTACTALPEIGDGDKTLPEQSKLAERVKIYVSSSLYSKLANATYYDRWSSQYCKFPDPSAN